jgi:hypothetical protein
MNSGSIGAASSCPCRSRGLAWSGTRFADPRRATTGERSVVRPDWRPNWSQGPRQKRADVRRHRPGERPVWLAALAVIHLAQPGTSVSQVMAGASSGASGGLVQLDFAQACLNSSRLGWWNGNAAFVTTGSTSGDTRSPAVSSISNSRRRPISVSGRPLVQCASRAAVRLELHHSRLIIRNCG